MRSRARSAKGRWARYSGRATCSRTPVRDQDAAQAALQDEADFQRFINEATVIAQLFHPNIVEVREFRRDAKCGPFLVMELLHGNRFTVSGGRSQAAAGAGAASRPSGRKCAFRRPQLGESSIGISPRNIFWRSSAEPPERDGGDRSRSWTSACPRFWRPGADCAGETRHRSIWRWREPGAAAPLIERVPPVGSGDHGVSHARWEATVL